MPRFFFQIYDAEGEPQLDREGLDLSDVEMARGEAIRTLREMACFSGGEIEDQRYFAVDVVDELGNTVVRARLSETIETVGLTLSPPPRSNRLADSLPAAFALSQTTH